MEDDWLEEHYENQHAGDFDTHPDPADYVDDCDHDVDIDSCDCCDCTYARILRDAPEGPMKDYVRAQGPEGIERLREFFAPAD